MKSYIRYHIIAVLLLGVMLLSACERTELCYDHYPKASIAFSWEQEWERDYGMNHAANWDPSLHGFEYDFLKPGLPEWVNMVRYKNGESDGEQYYSNEGGDVAVRDDADYSFLLYNGDTEYIVFSDIASLAEVRASATTRTRSSISYIMSHHPGLRSTNPPDILYASYIDNLPRMGAHQTTQIPTKMQPLVFTYVIRYEFEHGIEHVALARGAIAGLAESVYLRDGRTSDESAIILFDCDVKDYGCEAKVKSFGIPGFPDEYYGRAASEKAAARPYTLNLEVRLQNGKTVEFNYDVQEQLLKQPKGGVITIFGIRIEDEQNEPNVSSGFDVDLDGWGDSTDVDLPVGTS